MSVRDVFNRLGRSELLPLPEDVYATLAAAQVKFKTEYPDAINELTKMVPDVNQISGPLNSAFNQAGSLINVLIGDAGRLPSGSEVSQAVTAFANVQRQVKNFIEGMKQNQRLDRVTVIAGRDAFPYLVGMHSFTGLLSLRFKAAVEAQGGANRLASKGRSRGKEVRGALGAFFKSAQPVTGRPEVDMGLAVILGPLAPLAIGLGTGIKGASAVMRENAAKRRGLRDSIETAKLTTAPSSGLGGRPAGFIPPAMGGGIGGFPMSRMMPGMVPSGPAPSAGGAMNLTRQMMIGAIISGMSMFSASQAMKIGWHKRVLDLLEKQAKGVDPKHPFSSLLDTIGKVPWVAVGLAALKIVGILVGLAATVAAIGDILNVGGKGAEKAKKLGLSPSVGYGAGMAIGVEPGMGEAGFDPASISPMGGPKLGKGLAGYLGTGATTMASPGVGAALSIAKAIGWERVTTAFSPTRMKAPALRSEGEDIARISADAAKEQNNSFLKMISDAFTGGFDKLKDATKASGESPREQARMPYDNPDPLVLAIDETGLEQ